MLKSLIFTLVDLMGINALFRRMKRGQIKVLLYHNVTDGGAHFDNALSPEAFSAQIAYLKRHFNIIGIDQSGEWQGLRDDRVNVLISFDDGFRNNLTHALPVLHQHGVPAIFFLIADCIDTGSPPGFITERLGKGAEVPEFSTLNADDVCAMIACGMTIGSHSLSHRNHADMDEAAMVAEGVQARSDLEARFALPIASFAFPWGKHRPGQEKALEAVYRRIFLTRHGFCRPQDSIIPRNEVTTLAHLKLAASGALDALRGAVRGG
ncbi:MAG: polysaccharide deacetylase family protein [Blastomonas sp.]